MLISEATYKVGQEDVIKIFQGTELVWPLNQFSCDDIQGVVIENADPFSDGSQVVNYHFDDNLNDACGNHDGTWVGSATYTSGKFDKAVLFDRNNYVFMINSAAYIPLIMIVAITHVGFITK